MISFHKVSIADEVGGFYGTVGYGREVTGKSLMAL